MAKQRSNADSTRRRKIAQRKNRGEEEQAPAPLKGEVRLNRFVAQTGLCSRRTADEWIAQGRVAVNGTTTTEMGTKVDSERDSVTVDGRPVQPQAFVYILLNKPKDTITTTDDEKDRRTVMDLLDDDSRKAGVVPVGRLDRDTTGVLVLTNDGELAHRLMHPKYEIEKYYRVRTSRPLTQDELRRLEEGVELEDGPARADQVAFLEGNDQVAVSLHEGRNRQIRRMFEAIGVRVDRLERARYAGLTTDGLGRGAWRALKPHEVNRLRRSVKLKTHIT